MNRRNLANIVLGISVAAGGIAYGADEKAAPAVGESPAAASTAPATRDFQAIMQDVQKEGQSLQSILSSPSELTDEAKRKEIAPKAVPTLKRLLSLFNELKATKNPQALAMTEGANQQITVFLALFGDKETRDQLETRTKGSDAAQALDAKGSLLMVHWIEASKDADAQQKLLDEAQKLARDNPDNAVLTATFFGMGQIGASSPDVAGKIKDIAVSMNTPMAKQMKEEVDHEKQLASMENKPLTIEAVKLDGTKFSTADWKGKVIFVDFWATWCAPCRAELPRVKKAYADFHDKGLEVLGVSCDNEASQLQQFLDQNKDMPWPQLFDAKNPGWHPLAKSYGIDAIPTMFLIDKKGILRSVDARENFEEMIPKLLAEKD